MEEGYWLSLKQKLKFLRNEVSLNQIKMENPLKLKTNGFDFFCRRWHIYLFIFSCSSLSELFAIRGQIQLLKGQSSLWVVSGKKSLNLFIVSNPRRRKKEEY